MDSVPSPNLHVSIDARRDQHAIFFKCLSTFPPKSDSPSKSSNIRRRDQKPKPGIVINTNTPLGAGKYHLLHGREEKFMCRSSSPGATHVHGAITDDTISGSLTHSSSAGCAQTVRLKDGWNAQTVLPRRQVSNSVWLKTTHAAEPRRRSSKSTTSDMDSAAGSLNGVA